MKTGFNDLKNLGKNFENILTMAKKDQEKKTKSKSVLGVHDFNSEIEADPIFLKIECLKKILFKFSNKTYTYKNEKEDEENYEILIKIKICDVFNHLMDLREDFMIDNLMSYFRSTFIEKFKDNSHDFVSSSFNFSDFTSLLPEKILEVGEKYSEKEAFRNYSEFEEVKFFDGILERPFLEIILMSFYFTNNASLQNRIIDLLHRCCNQKTKFVDLVDKLEILFSREQIEVYETYDKMVQKLNLLIASSQVCI